MPDLSSASIVFANNFAAPGVGGGEVQLMHIVRACMAEGMRVTVVVQRGAALAGLVSQAGGEVIEADFGLRSAGQAVVALRAAALDADIVQGTGWWTNVLVRIAGARLPGIAVVNLVQVEPGAARFEGASRASLAARSLTDRATRRNVDAYIAVSEATAQALVARGVARDDVTVIHNGIDLPALQAAASTPLDPRIASALPAGDGPLVLCVARLEPVKGVEHFVRAAALLEQDHPNARFAVAGAGAEEGRLRVVALAAGLASRFVFLGNVSPIEPLLDAASVIVIPSLSEGMPMVALESGALGRPVVASAVGGLREAIDNGETGLLVPAADPVALAGGIGALLHDPDRARAMGDAARIRVREHFTVDRMGEAYLMLYRRLIEAGDLAARAALH